MKVFLVLLFFTSASLADTELKAFCKKTVETAESVRAIEGKDGWLFPFKEIQHLSREVQFTKKTMESIADYQKALAKEGVELLVVPVPPKALIYKELLVDKNSEWNPYIKFHQELKELKIKSLDLVPLFYQKKDGQVFCKRDSHFSPQMSKLIARAISEKEGIKKGGLKLTEEKIKLEFEGDLVRQSTKEFENESFTLDYLSHNKKFLDSDPNSSIVLLGDSNCLVFSSGGDMHARGAGIFDYLSQGLGQRIDLLGVKGSGIDTARVDLFRRSMDINYLRKKKLVIWLFAAYELTESRGWKKIPVRR